MRADGYILYVSDYSPYSYKAAAALGWAGVDVRVRSIDVVTRKAVLERMTGKTMVPMLRRGGWAIHDSTRIVEFADERARGAFVPDEEEAEALCWLLEEFADEWVTRWFVWARWHIEANAEALSERIGLELTRGLPAVGPALGRVASRMIAERVAKGGAHESNAAALGRTRDRTLEVLEALLSQGPANLFGGAPTVADFALYGQLEQFRRDPGNAARMSQYPAVCAWLQRIDVGRPGGQGAHLPEAWRGQGPRPLAQLAGLFEEMMRTLWPVLVANHEVVRRDEPARRAEAMLGDGVSFGFVPSRYVASRLGFVLEHLEVLARRESEVLGGARGALEGGLTRLSRYVSGREALAPYPALRGMTGGPGHSD